MARLKAGAQNSTWVFDPDGWGPNYLSCLSGVCVSSELGLGVEPGLEPGKDANIPRSVFNGCAKHLPTPIYVQSSLDELQYLISVLCSQMIIILCCLGTESRRTKFIHVQYTEGMLNLFDLQLVDFLVTEAMHMKG